ncbi:MAG: hypothetical protein M3Q52_01530 [Pseudomonadota bacterium]|nr:hypothetical protein [Pseudomonadota bacterium]
MIALRMLQLVFGKALVVLGHLVVALLAVAVPLAFVTQAAAPLMALQIASLLMFAAFTAIMIGDDLADRSRGRRTHRAVGTGRPELALA